MFVVSTGLLFVLLTNFTPIAGEQIIAGIASVIGGVSLTGVLQLVIGGVLSNLLGRIIPIRESDEGDKGHTGTQSINAEGDAEADVNQQQNQTDGQVQDVDVSVDNGSFGTSQSQGKEAVQEDNE
jgi:hypothetical protein